MLPWQHNSLLVNEYNYTFIACIVEGYMSPHYNVLPGAVCCCLQTCNYDHSLVVTDTNTPTKFQVVILLTFAHHSPIDLRWGASLVS